MEKSVVVRQRVLVQTDRCLKRECWGLCVVMSVVTGSRSSDPGTGDAPPLVITLGGFLEDVRRLVAGNFLSGAVPCNDHRGKLFLQRLQSVGKRAS